MPYKGTVRQYICGLDSITPVPDFLDISIQAIGAGAEYTGEATKTSTPVDIGRSSINDTGDRMKYQPNARSRLQDRNHDSYSQNTRHLTRYFPVCACFSLKT